MKNNNIEKGERGVCWTCPYYVQYANYCDYYKMYLNDIGREPTCNNPEFEKKGKLILKIMSKYFFLLYLHRFHIFLI